MSRSLRSNRKYLDELLFFFFSFFPSFSLYCLRAYRAAAAAKGRFKIPVSVLKQVWDPVGAAITRREVATQPRKRKKKLFESNFDYAGERDRGRPH